ncbi:glycosyltransferase family 39 protein [Streptomyces chumphonensis]|uniref:glycosyltransferase family 39 protein n=1 Tax=Streptomyces chumphonensis TaxID=1214925 RepID=UPI002964EEFF|nr:glycosyltransferase family 39 protein [Streptomyces chumphonensis]
MLPALLSLGLGAWGTRRGGSMWRDEAVTESVAHRSLSELWLLVQDIDAVHALHYLMVHGWFALWDGGTVALRAPSVLATAVATVGVAAVAGRLVSPRAGFLAGMAYASTPMVQDYALEGRSYALVAACVVWSSWFFVRAVQGGHPGFWGGYAIVATLGCWLNLFAVLAVVAHGVTLRLTRVSSVIQRRFLLSVFCVGAGSAPLGLLAVGQAEAQLGWLSRPGLVEWAGFIAVASVGILLSTVKPTARGSLALRDVALPLLVVPTGLLMLISMIKPYYVDRYVMYSMAGLALLVGAAGDRALHSDGLRKYHRRPLHSWAAVAAIPAVVIAFLAPWHATIRSPEARKDNVLAISEVVNEIAQPGDAVLLMPARRRDWVLHDPVLYGRLNDIALAQSPAASGTLRGVEYPGDQIRRRILAEDRVIALTDPAGQPLDQTSQEKIKRETLQSHFTVCQRVMVHGAEVRLWARDCAGIEIDRG